MALPQSKEDFLKREPESLDSSTLNAIGAKLCELLDERKETNMLLRDIRENVDIICKSFPKD